MLAEAASRGPALERLCPLAPVSVMDEVVSVMDEVVSPAPAFMTCAKPGTTATRN